MDPALWELLRAEAGTDGDRVLEASSGWPGRGSRSPTCGWSPASAPSRPAGSGPGTSSPCGHGPMSSASRRRASSAPDSSRRLSLRPIRSACPCRTCARPMSGARPGLGLTGAGVVVAAVDWGDRPRLGRVPVAGRPAGERRAGPPGPRASCRSGTSGIRRSDRARSRTDTGAFTAGRRSTARCATRVLTSGWDTTRRSPIRGAAVRTAPGRWISRLATARPTGQPGSRRTRT